jgi:hypothetical protein
MKRLKCIFSENNNLDKFAKRLNFNNYTEPEIKKFVDQRAMNGSIIDTDEIEAQIWVINKLVINKLVINKWMINKWLDSANAENKIRFMMKQRIEELRRRLKALKEAKIKK